MVMSNCREGGGYREGYRGGPDGGGGGFGRGGGGGGDKASCCPSSVCFLSCLALHPLVAAAWRAAGVELLDQMQHSIRACYLVQCYKATCSTS